MVSYSCSSSPTPNPSVTPAIAAHDLVRLLAPLLTEDKGPPSKFPGSAKQKTSLSSSNCGEILSAIQTLVPTLTPDSPIFASFHDGQVHDPLGGGSYAFQKDVVEPTLQALMNDEILASNTWKKQDDGMFSKHHSEMPMQLPTRPIIIHAGAQPNSSPHAGTLVVFCYAFAMAREIRHRMQVAVTDGGAEPPSVSIQITFVDTAPVKGQEIEINGIQYQKSYRDIAGALNTHMDDYNQILGLLSTWSGIPYATATQFDFFHHPTMPSIIRYLVGNHDLLGRQLSPKYGVLALRAACPVADCGLAEKHGRLNVYHDNSSLQAHASSPKDPEFTITFQCPHHGPHTIRTSELADIARLEANAPTRNLIRSMSQLLDVNRHHLRVTGADYAGMYQEVFLYRPLAAWSGATGLALGRTPHILYAPLIVDWSGAKLSKSLYVREGGYETMKLFGTNGLCSFAQLKKEFGDHGEEGLRRLWEEVKGWLDDPKKLFRSFSVEYLRRVIMQGQKWA